MKIIGIIDMGSNSMRLILAEVNSSSFTIIDELKETVRLEANMGEEMKLSTSSMAKAIQTIHMFKSLCSAVEADEIIAVATAAVRKASNRGQFLEKIKEETGIEVRVLSGEEEAYYDYLSTVNSLDIPHGLIVDIGGGSTELIWMQDKKIMDQTSLPFGSIDLAQRFNLYNKISSEQEEALRKFLLDWYKKIPWLSEIHHPYMIGIGGTMRNIGKIDRHIKGYAAEITHNYRMDSDSLGEIYQLVRSKSLARRKKIKGLSKDRADIFVGAAGAISILADYCNVKNLVISGSGLREGLVYEYLLGKGNVIDDVLDFSINSLINHYHLNRNHAYNVYRLTKSLYRQLKPLHNISDDVEKVLKTAALLHDSGTAIRYYSHHKHSLYIILNSGINGLTHRELFMSAYTAASHRKNDYKPKMMQAKGLLSKDDAETIMKIAVLLRIAESLDRRMDGLVTDVNCKIQDKSVLISVIAEHDPILEINDAMTARQVFKKIYGRELTIQWIPCAKHLDG